MKCSANVPSNVGRADDLGSMWGAHRVIDQDAMVRVLAARRRELGLTCLDVDHLAGFHEGYTAHLEHPGTKSGRNSLRLNPMAQLWLEALGLELVIRPRPDCALRPKTRTPTTAAHTNQSEVSP